MNDTPAAKWREEGKQDPHGDRYNCKRSELGKGQLTDDELANAQYMVDGDLVFQTAVKDRIRWLSRQLENIAKPSITVETIKAETTPQPDITDSICQINHWVSTKDRMPEHKQKCLISFTHDIMCQPDIETATYGADSKMFHCDLGRRLTVEEGITHWMALPKPNDIQSEITTIQDKADAIKVSMYGWTYEKRQRINQYRAELLEALDIMGI